MSGHLDELEKVEQRIRELKGSPPGPSDRPQAGVHLVFSMGFTVVGALVMGDFFGRLASEKAGNPQLRLVGWVLGLGLAAVAVYKQMRPFLK